MHVIAKMNVTSFEDYGLNRKIKFNCVYDNSINKGHESEENKSFSKATPSGEAWMTVDNQNVWPEFKLNSRREDGSYESASQHYVVFIDAKEYSLEDVQRALATLDAGE